MPSGEHGTLIGAMLDLGEKRRSGVLSVRAEEVTTHVTFDAGTPVDAREEGTPGEPLGRLLVRTRVLTPEQHAKVIDAMASSLGSNKEQKFGELAVSLGFLTKEKLEHALREQVRWRIVRALQREGAEWKLEEGPVPVGTARHELSLDAIIFDAVRWFSDERRKEAILGRGPFYVALRGQPSAVARRFGMTPEEQSALETIDGTETVADLTAIDSSETGVDLASLVVALVLAGVVELSDAPRARPEGAAARPASRPPPRPASGSQPPPPNQRIARTVARLKKAQARMPSMPPEERKPENEREARVFAEQCFQHGVIHLRANRLQQAVPLLRRAFGLMPKNLEYELYAMWTEVRVHRDKPSAAQLAALRNIAVAAIRQDPNLAFAYYVLGHVTLLEGSEVMAKRHFSHALRLDPEAIDAERHIRVLKRREARGASRVPQQVRRSRPPSKPPAPPPTQSSAQAVARVALKKATPDEVGKRPSLPTTTTPSAAPATPPPAPVAAADGAPSDADAPFVLYAKVQRTLELPARLKTPLPGEMNAAMNTPVAPPVAIPDEARGPNARDRSPLPEGPSSLTGIERSEGAERATPAPPEATKTPAAPPRRSGRASLYAGAGMMAAVLVVAFAMFGLRASSSPSPAMTPSAGVTASTLRLAPPVSATAVVSAIAPPPRASVTPSAVPAPSATPSAVVAPASASALVTPPPVASVAGTASASPSSPGGTGTVLLPKWAMQRRVYVDGRLIGDGPEKLVVPCGSREVKIGSSGKPKTIAVPCGGTVDW